MKGLWLCLVMVTLSVSVSNTQRAERKWKQGHHLFIITLDGFRWQELFSGADSTLLHNTEVTPNVAGMKQRFWAETPLERRKKLLPFFWSQLAGEGQVYGNRQYHNRVNVANPYALSYPGYSELLTGSVDLSIYNNDPKVNTNGNLLQELDGEEVFRGKVAAFTSWNMFPLILNHDASRFPISSGSSNAWQESSTRSDLQTYEECSRYIQEKKPSVVLLGLSGTDDAGHQNRYDRYLQQAHTADRIIASLWKLVQGMAHYAGKTTFLLTTDHGRGASPSQWHEHGLMVQGSSQTWMALLGRSVVPGGEMKKANQLYQKDLKELIFSLLQQ